MQARCKVPQALVWEIYAIGMARIPILAGSVPCRWEASPKHCCNWGVGGGVRSSSGNILLQHISSLKVTHLFGDYLGCLRHVITNLSKFWMSCMNMVETLLNLNRASRDENWNLHLSAIHILLPRCFAYHHINCAKYLSHYYAKMTNLPHENAGIHEYLHNGGFWVNPGRSMSWNNY